MWIMEEPFPGQGMSFERETVVLWPFSMSSSLQDDGDPAVEVSPRDIVYTLSADEVASNANAAPRVLAQTDYRSVHMPAHGVNSPMCCIMLMLLVAHVSCTWI
jgi:hypothetical protein